MTFLAYTALSLATLSGLLVAVNLPMFRRTCRHGRTQSVSVLVPARDEAANLPELLRGILASQNVDLEVLVLDDHSSDDTADIARAVAARDPRVRLIGAPSLPAGWSGKQHACRELARHATRRIWVFLDADVRVTPDALSRLAGHVDRSGLDLASGFPRQRTVTLGETLIVPLIHFLFLGYLPLPGMRWSRWPAFAAGCGQLMAVRADAYRTVGGHAAIRQSLHDGLSLPRAFRRRGFKTDVVDVTDLAHCRMYSSWSALWSGFSKNATEGMATVAALPVWTVLLGGGHLMPVPLVVLGALSGATEAAIVAALAAVVSLGQRLALCVRFRQSLKGVLLHPVGVGALLVLQWSALINTRLGKPAVWRGRRYEALSPKQG